MRKSLISSFALHGAILIAALFILPNPDQFKVPPQEAVQVDISNIGDVTKKVATSTKAAPPSAKVAPPKAEQVKKVDPAPKIDDKVKTAAKEPTSAPPPPPEPKKEEPKKEEPKKAPEPPKEEPKPLDPTALNDLLKKVEDPPPPKKEEVKKAEVTPPKKPEVKKPEKKKPSLDVNDIEAFLNKTDDTKAAPQQSTEVAGTPKLGEKELKGSDDAASATLIDALRQKLADCWSVPPGAREANISVKVRFSLAPDGSVTGQPQVLNGTSDPLFSITAQSAVSAVLECQSYSDIFPPDKYDLWKDNTVNFNPNMMLGL